MMVWQIFDGACRIFGIFFVMLGQAVTGIWAIRVISGRGGMGEGVEVLHINAGLYIC